MRQVSNTALYIALPAFIMAVSLALLTAAWLMVSCIANGPLQISWPAL